MSLLSSHKNRRLNTANLCMPVHRSEVVGSSNPCSDSAAVVDTILIQKSHATAGNTRELHGMGYELRKVAPGEKRGICGEHCVTVGNHSHMRHSILAFNLLCGPVTQGRRRLSQFSCPSCRPKARPSGQWVVTSIRLARHSSDRTRTSSNAITNLSTNDIQYQLH
jgi:hypothetical protein